MAGIAFERAELRGQTIALRAIARLIEQRCELLGESAVAACIATAINALVSVRARTRVFKADRAKPRDFGVEVTLTGWCASWTVSNGRKRRVARTAPKSHVKVDAVNLMGGSFKPAHVYSVRVWDRKRGKTAAGSAAMGRTKAYYAIAPDAKTVTVWATEGRIKKVKRYAGLARKCVSKAIAKANKPSDDNMPSLTPQAEIVAHRQSSAVKREAAGQFSLVIADTLRYAVPALKHGRADIDNALKAAANKIAGRLRTYLKRHGDAGLVGTVPTPFPEIVRRRAKK